jgi:hypothetical protein
MEKSAGMLKDANDLLKQVGEKLNGALDAITTTANNAGGAGKSHPITVLAALKNKLRSNIAGQPCTRCGAHAGIATHSWKPGADLRTHPASPGTRQAP